MADHLEQIYQVFVVERHRFSESLCVQQILYFVLKHLVESFLEWKVEVHGFARKLLLSLQEESELLETQLARFGPLPQKQINSPYQQFLLR